MSSSAFFTQCGETFTGVLIHKKVNQRVSLRYRESFRRTSTLAGGLGNTSNKWSSSRRTGSSLKRNIIREFFSRNKEVKISQRQNFEFLLQDTRAKHAVSSIQNLNKNMHCTDQNYKAEKEQIKKLAIGLTRSGRIEESARVVRLNFLDKNFGKVSSQ